MMDSRSSTVERAYELARSGLFRNLTELRLRLRAEGFVDAPAQISGPTLTGELRRLLVAARLDV